MDKHFEYRLRVSGGYGRARLTLSGSTAEIEYRSGSMGRVPVHFIMQCKHTKLSDYHGFLVMSSLEQYDVVQNEYGGHFITDVKRSVDIASLIDPEVDESLIDVMNALHIEYICLPQPQQRLEEPGGNFGVHEWLDTFSLILLTHYAGFWYEDEGFVHTPLGSGLAVLDKMHFALAPDKFTLAE